MHNINRSRLLLILSIAIVARLVFFGFSWYGTYALDELRPSDAIGYDRLALNLVEGNGFSRSPTPPFEPDLNRTPLYPSFLAAVYWPFGHRPWIAILLQIAISSLMCVMVARLEDQTLGRFSTGVSGCIVALYPLSIVYDNTILTESLFTALLVAAVLMFIQLAKTTRPRDALFCGVFCGLSAMCRPIATFLVVLLAVYLAVYRPIRKKFTRKGLAVACLCLGLGFFACVGPWVARNLHVSGRASISEIGGAADLWVRPLAYVRSIKSGEPIWGTYFEVLREYEAIGSDYALLFDFFLEGAREIVRSQPPYPVLHFWGTFVTLFSSQTALIGDLTGGNVQHVDALMVFGRDGFWYFWNVIASSKGILAITYLVGSGLITAIIYALAVYGTKKRYREPAIFLSLLVAAYLILPIGAAGDGRHRVPAIPFIALLCSAGIAAILEKRSGAPQLDARR